MQETGVNFPETVWFPETASYTFSEIRLCFWESIPASVFCVRLFLLFVMAGRGARYTVAQALQLILQSDEESDFSENDSASEDEDHISDGHEVTDEQSCVESETNDAESFPEQNARQFRGRPRGRGRRARGRVRGLSVGRGRGQDLGNDLQPNVQNQNVMVGRNGKMWTPDAPQQGRRQLQDIIRHHPGVTPEGHVQTIKAAFELFVTPEMLDIIMRETNREASRVYAEWNTAHPNNPKNWTETNIPELKAFIGLLLSAGTNRAHMEPITDLWSTHNGRPLFIASMSRNRFTELLKFLRFDNKQTRPTRRATDKLAAFRDIWEMFVANLKKYYIPGTDLTVDEQLIPFRGKCPFRQYMPSKPAKYGIKVWWNCDADTSYPLKGEIYLGKQPGQIQQVGLGSTVVMNTTAPWHNTGRNIVCDNFFTSIPLAEELLQKHTTIVGTLRQNKPEIPPQMKPNNNRPEKTSIFGFSGNLTLASYVPKKGRAVLVLSTQHHNSAIEGEDRKPEVVLYYNQKKSGVDNMDHLCSVFTCRRKTNRWPMTLFFNVIDVAGIAALVIWLSLNPEWKTTNPRGRRREFLQELSHTLTEEHIASRSQNPRVLQANVKLALNLLGKLHREQRPPIQVQPGRKRCMICPRSVDRKTPTVCSECNRHVCSQHYGQVRRIVCEECETD